MANINRERADLREELNSKYEYAVREINRKLNMRREEVANNRVRFENGVARWNSNNRAVPVECAVQFEYIGAPIDVEKTSEAEHADTEAFFAEYRKQQANSRPSDEEMYEMRAAFGEGTTVVDVITGRKIRL